MSKFSDALLAAAGGAAKVINEDAEKQREFMRKQKAKIAETRMIRQEKEYDARKSRYDFVKQNGTDERAQLLYAMSVHKMDGKDAYKAAKSGIFAKTLQEGVEDPGSFTPYDIAVTDKEYYRLHGDDSIAGKLVTKFSNIKERREPLRETSRKAHEEAVEADTPLATGLYGKRKDPAEISPAEMSDIDKQIAAAQTATMPTQADVDSMSAPEKTQMLADAGFPEAGDPANTAPISEAVAPMESAGGIEAFAPETEIKLQTTKDMVVDGVNNGEPIPVGISEKGEFVLDGKIIPSSQVSLPVKDMSLGAVTAVMYQGQKTLGQVDSKTGEWVIGGKKADPTEIVPLADTPDALTIKLNKLAEINTELRTEGIDPGRAATLEDQRTVIMGNISDAAASSANKRASRESTLQNDLSSLNISEKNARTLAGLITAEQGGPRALITKIEDNFSSYVAGLFGSDITAADIMNKYADIEGDQDLVSRYSKRASNAFTQGSAEFLSESIKYDIADAMKRGQKMNADDLVRVDNMLSAPFGSDRYAAQLAGVIGLVQDHQDKQMIGLMVGRNIPRNGIKIKYHDGERSYFYPIGDGKYSKFRP